MTRRRTLLTRGRQRADSCSGPAEQLGTQGYECVLRTYGERTVLFFCRSFSWLHLFSVHYLHHVFTGGSKPQVILLEAEWWHVSKMFLDFSSDFDRSYVSWIVFKQMCANKYSVKVVCFFV